MLSTPVNAQVLVADDEEDVVELVADYFTKVGWGVLRAADGEQALQIARTQLPSLVVLDLMMPKISGMDVLRALKGDPRTAHVGVIVLSARADEVDRLLAFELGTDDYLAKPFSPRELALRAKGILSHRARPQQAGRIRAGTITIDRDQHEVRVNGRLVAVTAVEFRLLFLLMQKSGRVLSRPQVIAAVWGDEGQVDPRTVDTHLRRLREKLGGAASHIETIRRVGYRFRE